MWRFCLARMSSVTDPYWTSTSLIIVFCWDQCVCLMKSRVGRSHMLKWTSNAHPRFLCSAILVNYIHVALVVRVSDIQSGSGLWIAALWHFCHSTYAFVMWFWCSFRINFSNVRLCLVSPLIISSTCSICSSSGSVACCCISSRSFVAVCWADRVCSCQCSFLSQTLFGKHMPSGSGDRFRPSGSLCWRSHNLSKLGR